MINRTIQPEDRYGRLKVVSVLPGKGKARCLFKCDCGREIVRRLDSIKANKYASCGCWGKEIRKDKIIDRSKVSDLIGMRSGRLLVTSVDNNPERKRALSRLVCLCDCGAQTIVRDYQIKRGTVKSCGCIQREWTASQAHKDIKTKHGHTRLGNIGKGCTAIYTAWAKIKQCCIQDRGRSYERVCHDYDKRWDKFEEFYKDFGEIRDDQTISRIDNQKTWCKENCYIRTTIKKGTSQDLDSKGNSDKFGTRQDEDIRIA